ncbi:lymphocyte expansion molecule isoform X2 [Anthonomus grandis grandis]|uniref:lymphocyte expansion molecule isoform X2 n=1 Tax=Anthonomus grandis grandis TaxID=2921223 RepID=UPI0021657D85|nr:lymphocyte expansion molecule isoform X2 [Anthonomus grandis grandis]
MPDKPFKTYAPFGVATKRFAKIGFHPSLDKSGAMTRESSKLGPGSYNPKQMECKCKTGMSWAHKKELEEYSKFLGFRNANILHERQFYRSMNGPGTSDVQGGLFKRQSGLQMENKGFGSDKRIKENIYGREAPPPDTYFRKLNDKFEPSKKSFSKTPTFEYDGLQDRFKSTAKSYHLPPNLYELHDMKNTADIVKRVVSARGPYECFTGPRDGSTIKNYFSPPKSGAPEYFYVKPSDLTRLLTHPSKHRYGLFLRGQRFQKKPTVRHMLNDISLCYRNPQDPGPAHYNLTNNSINKLPPAKYPFDSSNVHARPPVDWRILPGPGRYNPKAPRCMKVKRPSWVFLSKADRALFKTESYSLYI